MPAIRKASGEASVAFRLARSSSLISGTSMPASKGSPNDDKDVIRPSANAFASTCATLNNAPMAAASAVKRHGLLGVDKLACEIEFNLVCICVLFSYSMKDRQLIDEAKRRMNLKLNKIKFHHTSMAYVKKLSQFLYCDLYGTTFTCKHKDIHPFNQLTVVSKQLFNAAKRT
jgi:hypothetical protein